MPKELLTIAIFATGMTGIGLYLVGLNLVVDASLDRLANRNVGVPKHFSVSEGVPG
jgi:hypothetical protein